MFRIPLLPNRHVNSTLLTIKPIKQTNKLSSYETFKTIIKLRNKIKKGLETLKTNAYQLQYIFKCNKRKKNNNKEKYEN